MFRACIVALCLFFAANTAVAAQIVVAHDATWPPMEFVDAKRNLIGYSVDYIDAVAKEAGFSVVHKNVAWDGIFAGLAGNKYDLVASSVTITDERKKVMDFSTPYCEIRQALLTAKDARVAALSDMRGKNLGAQIGTTGYMAIKAAPGAIAKTYDEIGLAVAALAAGRIDGVVCDDPVARDYVLRNKNYADTLKVALIVPTEVPEFYGFAVNKGNKALLDRVNKGILAVQAKGIEKELRKKWMGE